LTHPRFPLPKAPKSRRHGVLFSTRAVAFNERTARPCSILPVPTDIVLLVVLWRLRDKLSVRDRAARFPARGFECTHATVRDGETRCAPLIPGKRRAKRKGNAGKSWYCDATYVRVGGEWGSLYSAGDRDGTLVDTMVSKTRARDAAKRLFNGAKESPGGKPTRVPTDQPPAYPRATRRMLGRQVKHRPSRYWNNRLAPDHRGVKQRYDPMRGWGNVAAAARLCQADAERRTYFWARSTPQEPVSLAEQRRLFRPCCAALQEAVLAA
jgi:putative transposase